MSKSKTKALDYWLSANGGQSGLDCSGRAVMLTHLDDEWLAEAVVTGVDAYRIVHVATNDAHVPIWFGSKAKALAALNDHIASEAAAIMGAS